MDIDKNKFKLLAPKERYEQQLDDVRWKFKADNIRIRDKHECRLCGAKKVQLDVHHIRYIYGREAWDYDDGDLVTLCHKCHEEIHDWQDFENLVEGNYFYDKFLKGVGIVEHKYSDRLWFNACWAGDKHFQENNEGRFYVESEASREDVRTANSDEINDFWGKVEKHMSIDMVIYYFGKHLKTLLPTDHPIRTEARNRFKEALEIFDKQWLFIKETFNYTLLISDEHFALLEDNRIYTYPYGWPANELPHRYFKVAPIKDVKEKPQENNIKIIDFKAMDFSKFRAASTDELQEWLEYEDHLANLLEELYGDDLPF